MAIKLDSTIALGGRRRGPRARAARGRGILALAVALALGATVAILAIVGSRSTVAPTGPVDIASDPPGAAVFAADRPIGRTPCRCAVPIGTRRLRLVARGYSPISLPIDVVAPTGMPAPVPSLTATLWPAEPTLRKLAPPVPGLGIFDAAFLDDGRVALIARDAGGERFSGWILGERGEYRRLAPPGESGPLALAADGTRIAYLARDPLDRRTRRWSEVWLTPSGLDGAAPPSTEPRGRRVYALPPSDRGGGDVEETLTDLAWSPDGRRLAIVARRRSGNSAWTTAYLLDTAASPRPPVAGGAGIPAPPEPVEWFTFPATIVPASFRWRADGGEVGFLAVDGRRGASLIVAPVATGGVGLRTLGELPVATRPIEAPLAWSPDGRRLAYGTARSAVGLLGERTFLALAATDGPGAALHEEADGSFPAWIDARGDGAALVVFGATRDRQGLDAPTLNFVAINPFGTAVSAAPLPLRQAAPAAVHWRRGTRQALLLFADGEGRIDAWEARWEAPR